MGKTSKVSLCFRLFRSGTPLNNSISSPKSVKDRDIEIRASEVRATCFGGRSFFYSLLSVFIVGANSFPWTFFDRDIPKILSSFQRQSPDQNHSPYGELQGKVNRSLRSLGHWVC